MMWVTELAKSVYRSSESPSFCFPRLAFRNSTRGGSSGERPLGGPVRRCFSAASGHLFRQIIRETFGSWYSASSMYDPSEPVLPVNRTVIPVVGLCRAFSCGGGRLATYLSSSDLIWSVGEAVE